MTPESLQPIARFFIPDFSGQAEPVGGGLIHHTFRLLDENSNLAYLLQQVNTRVFADAQKLQRNYRYVARSLSEAQSRFQLPEIIRASSGHDLYYEKNTANPWRMFSWVENSCSVNEVSDSGRAYTLANAFGRFSADLMRADTKQLAIVIPDFHNLEFRFSQLQTAIDQAVSVRLDPARPLLEALEHFSPLVDFFRRMRSDARRYRQYILHHDAKISNILFDQTSGDVITPVDLDTVMPGFFFSDFGDMVRSLAPDLQEDDPDCADLQIRSGHYEALREGYLERMYDRFTEEERRHVDYSGLLMAYMQSMRFLSDHLQGDNYYHTGYTGQNLERARNQFVLLQRLEDFVVSRYRIARCSK
jgi:aminoglycoside phosphotransferase (APT) family kinase protein